MEWLLPLFLGVLALAYVCSPLWAGVTQAAKTPSVENWHSVEQLEIDRELGKIDEAEFQELKPRLPVPTPARGFSLEALIFRARKQKRINETLETEVLIARARRRSRKELESEALIRRARQRTKPQ